MIFISREVQDWYGSIRATLNVTYQRVTRSKVLSLSRRYKADRNDSVNNMDEAFDTNAIFPASSTSPVTFQPINNNVNVDSRPII